MNSFAVVICKSHDVSAVPCNRILRFVKKFLERIKRKADHFTESIEIVLYENLKCFLIKLPYETEELRKLSTKKFKRIEESIRSICDENSIQNCILPQKISEAHEFRGCSKFDFNGNFLYRALMANIMDTIYTSRGINISKLDIVIIHGGGKEDTLVIIKLLSDIVKYITVAADSKQDFEEEAEEVFIDTGLVVRVTEDYKSALKSADFVINLKNIGKNESIVESALCKAINPKAVILNYGVIDTIRLGIGNTTINGLVISLPEEVEQKIQSDIFDYFSNMGLAELILFYRTKNSEDQYNSRNLDMVKKISNDFGKDGYNITGFVGRHNIIKTKEVKLR